MAPKKKKGNGKLSKMTEEERIAYLEQQRLAEEEQKKKKEELLSRYLLNKLSKEEQFTKLGTIKLNQRWRSIIRDLKSNELRNDLENLTQTFQRILDRKDSVISNLVREFNESEEQYMISLRCHFRNIDTLIDLQNQRLSQLTESFDDELLTVKKEFESENQYMTIQHEKQLDDLKDIFVALDKHFLMSEAEARYDYGSMRDELKNKSLGDKHALRTILEKKVSSLWAEFQTSLASYNQSTNERKAYFETFKSRDEKSATQIERQMLKIAEINNKINAVKARMIRAKKDYAEKNLHLKGEREKLGAHFKELKLQITKLRNAQYVKLTKMAIESNFAMNKVQDLNRKAAQIITIGEQCRKLETEEEKVLPFYVSCITAKDEQNINELVEAEGDNEAIKLLKRYAPLDLFWRRFNKVQLDRLALIKERKVMENENKNLKSMLSQYLDGISVNDDTLSKDNSLLIINGRTNVNSRNRLLGKKSDSNFVKLEAAHIVRDGVTSRILH